MERENGANRMWLLYYSNKKCVLVRDDDLTV